jgi:hypothetical protein
MSALVAWAQFSARRVIAAAVLFAAFASGASAMEQVTLPAPPNEIAFHIEAGGVSTAVTLPELERLGLYRVVTTSPYETGELTFEGVLFRDVLKKYALDEAPQVTVRATDDYVQIVPREDWADGPLLLATRQNGQPLTRRTQGPTRIVYPLHDHPAYDTPVHKPRWVWLVETIGSGN